MEQADPKTGLIRDRAHVDGSPSSAPGGQIASIAATGFGLTALSIGSAHHWIGEPAAREQVRRTLRFFSGTAPREHGWFYHWMDPATGQRRWNSEISSIDTALLLAGVLTARQAFAADPEIPKLARRIYERVDFPWMLNGDKALLSHGWKPESGFLRSRWDTYSELTILYLLAIASPTHPISAESWYAWLRPQISYSSFTYISGGPLFTHQYSHAWIDFRNLTESRPPYIDFFANSITATLAHRAFCIDLSRDFATYSLNIWGISASDSPFGYVSWGGPPRDPAIDGTVVPYAPAGSLMFTGDIASEALAALRDKYGDAIYGRYGFVDAFNPLKNWTDPDVIGIDLGITLLSAENLKTGNVWRWFMANPEMGRALHRIGFQNRVRSLRQSVIHDRRN